MLKSTTSEENPYICNPHPRKVLAKWAKPLLLKRRPSPDGYSFARCVLTYFRVQI